MASEIQAVATTGRTVYALIRNATGSVWNGTAFVTYATASYSTFVVTMTEQGTASGFYAGTFPALITTAGSYSIVVKVQSGGSPAEGDVTAAEGTFDWTGTAPTTLSDLATSGQVGQFAPIRMARGVAISGFTFYLKSSADHVTPVVSGVCSGQINRDGTGWTVLQSGILSTAYTELGNGFYRVNITSGDIACQTAAMLFNGVNVSGVATSDPCPFSLILQKTSGYF